VTKQTPIEAGPMNAHQRLSLARQLFHAIKLEKSGKNTFAGYSYFELGDFLVPALEVFQEVGLIGTVSFTSDLATLTIANLDDPSNVVVLTSPMGSAALKGCHEVQNIGAVETYQRRYLWITALEIVEHDALDATTGKAAPEKASNGKVSEAQFRDLQSAVDAYGADLARFCRYFQVPSLKDIPSSRFEEAMNALLTKSKRQKEPA
jgi:hypothetical protein